MVQTFTFHLFPLLECNSCFSSLYSKNRNSLWGFCSALFVLVFFEKRNIKNLWFSSEMNSNFISSYVKWILTFFLLLGSVTCGGGVFTRTRSQNAAVNGGAACVGSPSEVAPCNSQGCPTASDCSWNAWTQWSTCSASCATFHF